MELGSETWREMRVSHMKEERTWDQLRHSMAKI